VSNPCAMPSKFLDRQFSTVRFVWDKGLAIKQHRCKVHGCHCALHDRAALHVKGLGILELGAGRWPVPVWEACVSLATGSRPPS
jgi:hypothetical protein